MNLLYTTDFRESNVRGTLVVAPAALALMVMLLWLGSIRNPDLSSADKARLYSACPEGSLAPCADLTLAIPMGPGDSAIVDKTSQECTVTGSFHCMTESDSATAMEGTEAGEALDVQFPDASIISGEGPDNQRCFLPGIPCNLDSGNPVLAQSSDVLVTQKMRTY